MSKIEIPMLNCGLNRVEQFAQSVDESEGRVDVVRIKVRAACSVDVYGAHPGNRPLGWLVRSRVDVLDRRDLVANRCACAARDLIRAATRAGTALQGWWMERRGGLSRVFDVGAQRSLFWREGSPWNKTIWACSRLSMPAERVGKRGTELRRKCSIQEKMSL